MFEIIQFYESYGVFEIKKFFFHCSDNEKVIPFKLFYHMRKNFQLTPNIFDIIYL